MLFKLQYSCEIYIVTTSLPYYNKPAVETINIAIFEGVNNEAG